MKRKVKIISILMLLVIIILLPKSNAALVSKPTTKTDGSNVLVNSNISNSYVLCQNMKTDQNESLYGSSVKPHLATNKDWGAVSYLSNSIYGTNTQGQNTGIEITINGVKYYSTNGNTSGVMNWGSNPYRKLDARNKLFTQTAGIIKAYMNLADSTISPAHDYVTALEAAAKSNSQYVEVVEYANYTLVSDVNGTGIKEIFPSFDTYCRKISNNTDVPISYRMGLFGYLFALNNGGSLGDSSPVERNYVTFRPVVWN